MKAGPRKGSRRANQFSASAGENGFAMRVVELVFEILVTDGFMG